MLLSVVLLIGASVFYISTRFAVFFPAVGRKAWIVAVSVFMLVVITCVAAFSTTPHPIGRALFMFGGVAGGAVILLLMSLIVTDVVHLVCGLGPRPRCAATFALLALLLAYSVWNARHVRVNEVTIPVRGLTQEVRALHLTDVHLGNFRGQRLMEELADKIRELQPDVIFNTGDMFDSKNHFATGDDVLSPLSGIDIPHYFVYGNHDEYVGLENVVERMRKAGCRVLLNEVAEFGELQIVGLNNMLPDRQTFDPHAKPGAQTVEEVLDKLDLKSDKPTILLHHRPDGVNYMQEHGVDLLLSGHTHGGQLFPITIVSKLMFGYNTGLYEYKDMAIHVSEGIGTIFSPMRLGTKSGMTLIHLVPTESIGAH